ERHRDGGGVRRLARQAARRARRVLEGGVRDVPRAQGVRVPSHHPFVPGLAARRPRPARDRGPLPRVRGEPAAPARFRPVDPRAGPLGCEPAGRAARRRRARGGRTLPSPSGVLPVDRGSRGRDDRQLRGRRVPGARRRIGRGESMSTKTQSPAVLAFLDRDLAATDPDVALWIAGEVRRQNEGLELIASENWVSRAVREAQGSVLTNKYAEGYPGKRYYGGCEFIDKIESVAIERAKALFAAEHANVQPHSGSQANMAVYLTALKPGDTILGMDLSHGGHLTHGHPLSFSGKEYKVVAYGVRREDERIDYDALAALAREHRPKMIIAGASAYAREIDFPPFAPVAPDAA